MQSRTLFLAAASLLWIFAARAAESPASPLVGRWRSLETPKDDVGGVFQFYPSGVLDYSPAMVVELPYRVEGDTLLLPGQTRGDPEQKQTILWVDDDQLRLSAPGTQTLQLVRRSPRPDAQRSIVGEWSGSRELGGKLVDASYVFSPKGRVLLIMPFLTSHGRYTVDGAKIHLSVPDRWSSDGTFKIEGDTLTLSIPSSKGTGEWRYARY